MEGGTHERRQRTHPRKERAGSAGEVVGAGEINAGDLISRERFCSEFINRVVSRRIPAVAPRPRESGASPIRSPRSRIRERAARSLGKISCGSEIKFVRGTRGPSQLAIKYRGRAGGGGERKNIPIALLNSLERARAAGKEKSRRSGRETDRWIDR